MTVLLREVLRRMPDYAVDESKVARYPTIRWSTDTSRCRPASPG